jgi:hypothetical protein
VWPLAADDAGIWLISDGDPWRPASPVTSDSGPHADVERELAAHAVRSDAVLVHSTSWRVDGPDVILTYLAVIDHGGSIRDRWPGALRISAGLVYAAGEPESASPLDEPSPRSIGVLLHAVRHLRFCSTRTTPSGRCSPATGGATSPTSSRRWRAGTAAGRDRRSRSEQSATVWACSARPHPVRLSRWMAG